MLEPGTQAITARAGLAYGLLGLPLAFVALPLYVALPQHYASAYGLPLATLGAVLLFTRLFDALLDPWLGSWLDRAFLRGRAQAWAVGAVAAVGLFGGMLALWWPPQAVAQDHRLLMTWLVATLMLTYVGFSLLTIAHQAWGARWGGSAEQRAQWVAWREGATLAGVIVASVMPSLAGQGVAQGVMGVTLVLGLWALWHTHPWPTTQALGKGSAHSSSNWLAELWMPWRAQGFAKLMAVFILNGVASAVPATLLLFFVRDRLQAPQWQGVFLAGYFVAAAVALPLWTRAVRRLGLRNTWLVGMVLSVLAFSAVPWLGAGDQWPFLWVCLFSGAALGADLVVPGALLAGLVAKAGMQGQGEGRFFAWWAFANKLNLALAAGLALPLLAWLGYQSGATDPSALQALAWAYGAVPCLLKALAALVLWQQFQSTKDNS